MSLVPAKSFLLLRNLTPERHKVLWKWRSGDATARLEFGDPRVDTSYTFCVYDNSDTLILAASAPADDVCRTKPCWKENAKGFRYSDVDLTPDGLRRVDLKEGDAGKAKDLVLGSGALLDAVALPITNLPLTAQLQNTDGVCWDSTFTTPTKNDSGTFKSHGP